MRSSAPLFTLGTRAPRLLLALVLAGVMVVSAGCTIFYLVEQDPEGLPCDPTGGCLANYICVEGYCRTAAQGGPGTQCTLDDECEDGLICADAYAEDQCANDINCALGAGEGLRCRTICNPAEPARDNCPGGDRCHADQTAAVQGWCQSGTCELDSDCGTNTLSNLPNLCSDISNVGAAGLCFLGCDPLQCSPAAGCSGCPVEKSGCEPVDLITRFGCIEPGTAPHQSTCGQGVYCQAGSFCFIADGQTTGVCARFCDVQGGAPACDAPARCNAIDANSNVGICL